MGPRRDRQPRRHRWCKALDGSDQEVREQAAWALGAIGDSPRHAGCSVRSRTRTPSVRRQAAWAHRRDRPVASLPRQVAARMSEDARYECIASGSPLRRSSAAALAWIQPGRHRRARDRHRRQHRHLQRHQHAPPPAAALSRRRPPGDRVGAQPAARPQGQRRRAGQLPSLARDEPGLRGSRRDHVDLQRHAHRRRRARGAAGAVGLGGAVPDPRRRSRRSAAASRRTRTPGSTTVALISDRLWKRRFGGDRAILERADSSPGHSLHRRRRACRQASRSSTRPWTSGCRSGSPRSRGRRAADRSRSSGG